MSRRIGYTRGGRGERETEGGDGKRRRAGAEAWRVRDPKNPGCGGSRGKGMIDSRQ